MPVSYEDEKRSPGRCNGHVPFFRHPEGSITILAIDPEQRGRPFVLCRYEGTGPDWSVWLSGRFTARPEALLLPHRKALLLHSGPVYFLSGEKQKRKVGASKSGRCVERAKAEEEK